MKTPKPETMKKYIALEKLTKGYYCAFACKICDRIRRYRKALRGKK